MIHPDLRLPSQEPAQLPDAYAGFPGTTFPNGTPDAPLPGVAPRADRDLLHRKLARLRELLQASLDDRDPRMAAIGVAEEAMLKMLVRLDHALESVLADSAEDLAAFSEVQPLMREMMRVAMIGQRYATLRLAFTNLQQALPEPH
jgi:hypothetical protein